MIILDELAPFHKNNERTKYIVPKLPPTPPDRRGFMYIVKNSKFPDLFKIGRTTDLGKRLSGYNEGMPMTLTKCHIISILFKDVHFIESRILRALRDVAEPLQLRREWFGIEHMEYAISLIEKAEEWEAAHTIPLGEDV